MRLATEKRNLEWCQNNYQKYELKARKLYKKLSYKIEINSKSKILEIGSAQGLFVLASQKLGFNCVGLEPDEDSILICNALEQIFNKKIPIKKGFAENIPYSDNSFDIVIALSVFEHVKDIEKVFREISRILKPKGALFFVSTSALCPRQNEISLFPLFGWYPNFLKQQIFNWVLKNKPELVGYTKTPAIYWFTPWMVKKLALNNKFTKIYDRWHLIMDDDKKSSNKKLVLSLINKNSVVKFIANVLKPTSSYLIIKDA